VKRTKQERFRLAVLFVILCAFFLVTVLRLVYLQVLMHPKYSKIVDDQTRGRVTIPAQRGIIYDRNGTVVADNISVPSLYAYPVNKKELAAVSRYLDSLFQYKSGTARKKYGLAPERFRWIKRRLDDATARYVERSAPRGLYLRKETRRIYPFGTVGKQILGFTDIDQNGLAGIEYSFDSLLAGQKGLADIRRDGLQNTYRVKEATLVKPVPGKSLVLTIDWELQEIVESELRAGVEEFNAQSGMAVFLDCRTGDILAASHFDPQEKNKDKPFKLRAVTDLFEPGSVFKAFTMAALLEAGLVDLQDSVYCEEGLWKVGRRYLHDDKKHGWLSIADVFHLSSNIGIAKCAIELGGDELYEAVRSFGVGRKLGVGLSGEAKGQIAHPQKWSDYTIAALAMGHSVSVTALQVAAGFGAIANGGTLLRPRLIRGYVTEGRVVPVGNGPEIIAQVMKDSTAQVLRTLLRGVVECGTGEKVNSPMVTIAGKTGTAEVPDLKNGGYIKNKFVASFAGFFPCERPLVAGIVVLREPEPVHYGGWTAGPVFRRIAEQFVIRKPDLFKTGGELLAGQTEGRMRTVEVPDFIGRDISAAKIMAARSGLVLHTNAESGSVVWQFPPADRLVFEGDEVLVAVTTDAEQNAFMADLRGLPMRYASAFLQTAGIKFKVKGHGRVVRQSIRPGQSITDGMFCRLECRPL
jgi:cell division protein FtsI/penicillin-binding protein 2